MVPRLRVHTPPAPPAPLHVSIPSATCSAPSVSNRHPPKHRTLLCETNPFHWTRIWSWNPTPPIPTAPPAAGDRTPVPVPSTTPSLPTITDHIGRARVLCPPAPQGAPLRLTVDNAATHGHATYQPRYASRPLFGEWAWGCALSPGGRAQDPHPTNRRPRSIHGTTAETNRYAGPSGADRSRP
jgi:hypothetical protein